MWCSWTYGWPRSPAASSATATAGCTPPSGSAGFGPRPQVVILTLMEGAWLDDRGRAAGAFEVLRKGCRPELIRDTVFAAWRARRNELEDR